MMRKKLLMAFILGFSVCVMFIPTPKAGTGGFTVFVDYNFTKIYNVTGFFWIAGSDVTLQIDSKNDGSIDYQAVNTVKEDGTVNFDLDDVGDISVAEGDLVRMSDNVDPANTHIHFVFLLTLNSVNQFTDTLTGSARTGNQILAKVFYPNFPQGPELLVTAGVNEVWSADFSALTDIVPGSVGFAWIQDDDWDKTQINWQVPQKIQNPHNGHLYQRFDNSMTWHEAKYFCENLGGHLATVTSQQEQDFVYDYIVSSSPRQMVWLGASDELNEGLWEWVTDEPWDYDYWHEIEPNNCSGWEHYLVIFTPYDFLNRIAFWNDLGEGDGGGCGCGGCVEEWYPMSEICEWDIIEVDIDIKPGSDPNCFNIDGHGVIPVAILGSSDFDVSAIDLSTLSFGGLDVRVRGNKRPLCSTEYTNEDEFLDLVCHFEDAPENWEPGSDTATLSGELYDGTLIEGTDSICIVP